MPFFLWIIHSIRKTPITKRPISRAALTIVIFIRVKHATLSTIGRYTKYFVKIDSNRPRKA